MTSAKELLIQISALLQKVSAKKGSLTDRNDLADEGVPSGELTDSELENHHAINGKIHYFDWAMFNCKLLVHQRVKLSHDFPPIHGYTWYHGAVLEGFSFQWLKLLVGQLRKLFPHGVIGRV